MGLIKIPNWDKTFIAWKKAFYQDFKYLSLIALLVEDDRIHCTHGKLQPYYHPLWE
ncbi:MAG: hypothetical protein QNK30_10755 [Bacteroidales bacterium]|nr:hypothetical protein [Bacteroidales bacterium]